MIKRIQGDFKQVLDLSAEGKSIGKNDRAVLMYLYRHSRYAEVKVTKEQAAEWLGVSTRTVQRSFQRLGAEGMIELVTLGGWDDKGNPKPSHYRLPHLKR